MRPVPAGRLRFSSWCPCTYISVCILGPARLSKRWIRGGDGLYGQGSGAAAAGKRKRRKWSTAAGQGLFAGRNHTEQVAGPRGQGTGLGRGLAEYAYLSKARLVDADSIGHACCQTFLSLWQHTRRARRFGPTMTESMREKGMTT